MDPVWSPDDRLIAVGTSGASRRMGDGLTIPSRRVHNFTGFYQRLWFPPGRAHLGVRSTAGIVSGRSAADRRRAHGSQEFVHPAVLSRTAGRGLDGWPVKARAQTLGCGPERSGRVRAAQQIVRSADLTPDGRMRWWATGTRHPARTIDLDRSRRWLRARADDYPSASHLHDRSSDAIGRFHVLPGHGVWDAERQSAWETSLQSATSDPTRDHSLAAAISPDGHVLALADRDLGIRLVSADSYADIRRWDAHTDIIWSFAFSPDGKWLLSTSIDKTIGVWDAATGAKVARLVGHNAAVFCAAVSPDGTRIASGGRDRYLRLWDTIHFENVAQLGGHRDYIYSLAWSPDGRQLISGSGDATVRLWDTEPMAQRLAARREFRLLQPEAERVVGLLFQEVHDAARVLGRVRSDESLSEPMRQACWRAIVKRTASKP